MTTIITPTIGRVVWFYPAGHDRTAQPLAATVSYVHSDSVVNLAAFDQSGNNFPALSVQLIQEDEKEPVGPFCCWMPYQRTQAQKALESVPVAPAPAAGNNAAKLHDKATKDPF